MTKSNEVADSQVARAARAVVANLKSVSAAASAHASRLAPRGTITVHSPVQSNTWTDGGPPSHYMKQRLEELGGEYESAIAMKSEPFVVRLVVEDQDDESQHVYYFSRGGKGASNIGGVSDGRLIGYRGGAPIGRLAAYEAGETAEIVIDGRPRTFRILERLRFVPKAVEADRWDGHANVLEADGRKSLRIASLLERLGMQGGAREANDLLRAAEEAGRREREQREALLREADVLQQQIEAAAQSERERRSERRRRVGAAIELRDQAILDRYQDEIFRLPLDRRLVLTGPPGTGKTTTLIKRIAQKCRFEELSDSDQELYPVRDPHG
jgi:flagellar biosynthesis GTPase FlhF